MTRRVLLPLLLLALAACGKTEAPTPTAPTAQSTAAMPASADEPAASTSAAPVSASTAAPAPNAAADAAAQQALAGANDPSGLVEGTDYVTIKGGEPWKPLDGKIEVVEVFGYVCPACASFDPLVSAWKSKLPADVRFSYVPAPFGAEWNPYAKAFYVAESMGLVDRSHSALIREIHLTQSMPGEGDPVDEQKIANFYGKYGANPKEFLSTMNSFSVSAQVNKGRQFMIRSGANSTPTLIVNGKYKVTGQSFEDMLRIASGLIAKERAAAGGAPAAAAPSQG
ncbi:thiol:disulfide interchange protein DsbA/DsbL [Noviluteimonas gilva]|uniref:Thioredoxin domain-containing protein n=1 Tax=Noviluteimonas gilva TaxID=2682097 RepID=A0A7C9M197_9GAMM|nr:thiol:disulfide interchange protein DsbA/DsbL [Lysobacter gilvus]MUV12986.1 thioredoxin domain-containing protein [Lysobacter gilvus]